MGPESVKVMGQTWPHTPEGLECGIFLARFLATINLRESVFQSTGSENSKNDGMLARAQTRPFVFTALSNSRACALS